MRTEDATHQETAVKSRNGTRPSPTRGETRDRRIPDPGPVPPLEWIQSLLELRPDQKRVLTLFLHQGLTYRQISRATGLSRERVRGHARRGLLRIQKMLERSAEIEPSGSPGTSDPDSRRGGRP
jgi:DNA-directed RNA polymerase specialized sigma24 family protein